MPSSPRSNRWQAVAPWDECGHRHRTYRAARLCGVRTFGMPMASRFFQGIKVLRVSRAPRPGRSLR